MFDVRMQCSGAYVFVVVIVDRKTTKPYQCVNNLRSTLNIEHNTLQ